MSGVIDMKKVLDRMEVFSKTLNSGDSSPLETGKRHKTSHNSSLLARPGAEDHSARTALTCLYLYLYLYLYLLSPGLGLIATMQEPHSPIPQESLQPVRPCWSRR